MDSDQRFIPLVDVQEQAGDARLCAVPCPFLGDVNDRITAHGFPHINNRCFKHEIAITKDFEFQRTYCLADDYVDCSIYQNKELPPIVEAEVVESKRRLRIPTAAILFVLVAIASVALYYTTIYAWNNPKDSSMTMPVVTNAILPTHSKEKLPVDMPPASLVDQNSDEVVDPGSSEDPVAIDSAAAEQEQLSESSGKGSFRAITYDEFNEPKPQ